MSSRPPDAVFDARMLAIDIQLAAQEDRLRLLEQRLARDAADDASDERGAAVSQGRPFSVEPQR